MIYAYLRVSTEKQTLENQRFEVRNWTENKHIVIDEFVEEVMSGGISIGHRKLGALSARLKADDILIVSELSRLGRSLLNVMSFLNLCIEKKVRIFSIKENFEFADNINSKVLAFAFSLAAEIERQLISQRTKEALALRRAQGVVLGRPKGSCGKKFNHICINNHDYILRQLEHESVPHIANDIGVAKGMLYRYLAHTKIYIPSKKDRK